MTAPRLYRPLGFRQAKALALTLLADGDIQHEPREAIAEKNLLAVGLVTPEFVAHLIRRCNGRQYASTSHHADRATEVHVFRPVQVVSINGTVRWYIKLYFRAGIIVISAHPG